MTEIGPKGSVRAVLVAGAAALLGSLDSALNIAFPDVTEHFGIDVTAIQWLVITYVLTYAVLLVVAGRIADQLGHRSMLAWGLIVSTTAFASTGLAPTYGWLLAARVLQGVGAAMILAAAPALVTLAVFGHRRGWALGLFQMSAALGLAIGPLVGGVLVAGFGWRAVFLFRVPFALVLLALVLAPSFRSVEPTVAFDEPAAGDSPARAWMTVLRHPPFLVANVLNLVSNAAMFAIWLLVPYYAVNVIDTGAVLGGVLLTIAPLATAVTAPVAGWLADRFGSGRLSSGGLALEAAGLGLLSRMGGDSSFLAVAAGLGMIGVSLSMFGVPNMRYVMGAIERDRQGVAGSIVQTMRTGGVVVGVYAASAWFESSRASAAERLGVAADGPVSFVPAFRSTMTAAAIVAAVAFVMSTMRGGRAGAATATAAPAPVSTES